MYRDEIKKYSPLTIEDIISTCQKLVPTQYNRAPWNHPEVNHGVSILRTDDGLNCYMAGYGESHAAKAFKAIKSLPRTSFYEPFEVYDWGCGQGVGPLCLIEHLRDCNLLGNLKQITLVEPSSVALSRAELNIYSAAPEIKIIKCNKGLPADGPFIIGTPIQPLLPSSI